MEQNATTAESPITGKICRFTRRDQWRQRSQSRDIYQSKPHLRSQQRRHGNYGRKRGPVHSIGQQSTECLDKQFQHMSFAEIKINSVDTRDEEYATLNIKLKTKPGNHTLKLKVDIRAQGNTLPFLIYRRMHPECLSANGFPKLGVNVKQQNTILTAYNGTRIKQFGVVTIPCQYSRSRCFDTKFFLVDTEEPGILGLPSLRQLDFVTLHCAVQAEESNGQAEESNDVQIDDLLKQSPSQFDSTCASYCTKH